MVGDFLDQVAWDRKANAGVHSANKRVHTDHFAFQVHQWAAAIPGIDQRIRLYEILVHRQAFITRKNIRTAFGADMADRDAVIIGERPAERVRSRCGDTRGIVLPINIP